MPRVAQGLPTLGSCPHVIDHSAPFPSQSCPNRDRNYKVTLPLTPRP